MKIGVNTCILHSMKWVALIWIKTGEIINRGFELIIYYKEFNNTLQNPNPQKFNKSKKCLKVTLKITIVIVVELGF